MVAGGILLLIVAIKLQEPGNWREEIVSSESIGAVPIGCLLLVGPGAITNTILSLQSAGATVTILSVLITFLIVWLVLRFVNPLYRILGKTGSLVITRVMSLLIAAIAVQYIFQGAKHII